MNKEHVLWRTSCLIPVTKLRLPAELDDDRPVALTSHIVKTLEQSLVRDMRLQVAEDLDPLPFACQKHIGMEDAILYMLHQAYAYQDVPGSYVRIVFFDFSSAFKTIRLSYSEISF